MNLSCLCAPLEGITGFPYRNTHHQYFGGVEEYFTPFLVANQTMSFKKKELRDVAPENNAGVPLVPQILTNKPDQFLFAVRRMRELGYAEVNLNLGCPMPMQVKKHRGAGFLEDPARLDAFFEEVFRELERVEGEVRISVKTRIGVSDASEAGELMKIFNRYPISRLIIHARRAVDLYKGTPDLETFGEMLAVSRHPVCYNGDLCTAEDVLKLMGRFPELNSVMIGRGVLKNPALPRELAGGAPLTDEELYSFSKALLQAYREVIPGETDVIFKMKELWSYMGQSLSGKERELKKIRKARTMKDYEEAAARLFQL